MQSLVYELLNRILVRFVRFIGRKLFQNCLCLWLLMAYTNI